MVLMCVEFLGGTWENVEFLGSWRSSCFGNVWKTVGRNVFLEPISIWKYMSHFFQKRVVQMAMTRGETCLWMTCVHVKLWIYIYLSYKGDALAKSSNSKTIFHEMETWKQAVKNSPVSCLWQVSVPSLWWDWPTGSPARMISRVWAL